MPEGRSLEGFGWACRQKYSAERMALVVLGGDSLDTLEGWVRQLFAMVPSGKGPKESFKGMPQPYQACSLHRANFSHLITWGFRFSIQQGVPRTSPCTAGLPSTHRWTSVHAKNRCWA